MADLVKQTSPSLKSKGLVPIDCKSSFVLLDPSGRGTMQVGKVKQQIIENNGAGICNSDIQEMFKHFREEDQIDMTSFINAVTNELKMK